MLIKTVRRETNTAISKGLPSAPTLGEPSSFEGNITGSCSGSEGGGDSFGPPAGEVIRRPPRVVCTAGDGARNDRLAADFADFDEALFDVRVEAGARPRGELANFHYGQNTMLQAIADGDAIAGILHISLRCVVIARKPRNRPQITCGTVARQARLVH